MAILDKFHLIRKAVALIQLFSCIIVFTFSLILLIIGSITVATANSTNGEFYHTGDYVSGGNLLIVSGIFGIIISIIGAVGAVPCLFDRQDNYNLWTGLIVLIIYILVLVGIFIFEISAGGWAYSKWDSVSEFLQDELVEDIQKNYGINQGYTSSVDSVQQEFMCCGIYDANDWKDSQWANSNPTRLPASCCSEPTNTTNSTNINSPNRRRELYRRLAESNTTNTTAPPTTTTMPEVICLQTTTNSYKKGCWDKISNALSSYTVHIAGVTIALAILQILIILVPIVLLVIVVVELRRSKSLEIK